MPPPTIITLFAALLDVGLVSDEAMAGMAIEYGLWLLTCANKTGMLCWYKLICAKSEKCALKLNPILRTLGHFTNQNQNPYGNY